MMTRATSASEAESLFISLLLSGLSIALPVLLQDQGAVSRRHAGFIYFVIPWHPREPSWHRASLGFYW